MLIGEVYLRDNRPGAPCLCGEAVEEEARTVSNRGSAPTARGEQSPHVNVKEIVSHPLMEN
jgi:hypothetical protein